MGMKAFAQLSKRIHGDEKESNVGSIDDTGVLNRVLKTTRVNTESINDLDLKLQLHESSVNDGHLVWKINNVQRRATGAIIGGAGALHSAPCFTSKYDYKFCLRLYLR